MAAAMRAGGPGPAFVPMSHEMAGDAFGEAVVSRLEAYTDTRLRQFLEKAAAIVSSPDN